MSTRSPVASGVAPVGVKVVFTVSTFWPAAAVAVPA